MSENTLAAPLPRAPHADTLRDPAHTIIDRSGKRLLCWCPRHKCGAVYAIDALTWSMQSPVAFGDFLQSLDELHLLPEPGTDDLARWIEACTQLPPGTPTAPGGRC